MGSTRECSSGSSSKYRSRHGPLVLVSHALDLCCACLSQFGPSHGDCSLLVHDKVLASTLLQKLFGHSRSMCCRSLCPPAGLARSTPNLVRRTTRTMKQSRRSGSHLDGSSSLVLIFPSARCLSGRQRHASGLLRDDELGGAGRGEGGVNQGYT